MCESDQIDTHFVRCLKCSKILKCSRYDTTALLAHIRNDHPEIDVVEADFNTKCNAKYSGISMANTECSATNTCATAKSDILDGDNYDGSGKCSRTPEMKICMTRDNSRDRSCDPSCRAQEDDAQILYTRRYQVHSASSQQSPRRRARFRTSIEKWRPAAGTIYCPKCGANKRPMIKTRSERASGNSCGAACLLSCWPFCFLPCLHPGDNREYLHCSQCKTFLGLYDRNSNCVRPNREYVDAVCHNPPPSPPKQHPQHHNPQRGYVEFD